MKIASNQALNRRQQHQELIIRDLAQQHQQLAENQAELLKMIIDLQRQIIELRDTLGL